MLNRNIPATIVFPYSYRKTASTERDRHEGNGRMA